MSHAAAPVPDAAAGVRVRSVRPLRGPSLWGTRPVVACEVEVAAALAGEPSGAGSTLGHRVAEALPGLPPAPAAVSGGAATAPSTTAGWAELVGRIAAELQSRAGTQVDFIRVIQGADTDPPQLAVGYLEEEVAVESLYEAAALLGRCLRGEQAEVERTVALLRDVYLREHPGPTASVLIETARRRGIPVRRFPGDPVVQLGLGRALRRLDAATTDFTSVIATDITSHKHRTKQLLARNGLPVPVGEVAAECGQALEIAADLGYPVLLKPLDANDGRGISGRLHGPEDVRLAWRAAAAEHPAVVVERFVEGRDHRVLVVNGRVVAVAERVAAHVLGDGTSTVRELAEAANRDPRRSRHDPGAPLVPLPLDDATARFLEKTGRTLDSVPAAGERVQLRGTANISTGGTSIDRTDEIHRRNAALCVLAAGAVGLDVAGIDVLTPDISAPFDSNGAVIVEVNASPGIRMHTDPDEGTPRDAAGAILDMLYPPGAPTTIPLVAVTGTNGKTTTTRLIAHLLRRTGACVGFTTTDGIYVQDDLLMEGDFTGPFAAGVVLSHPGVDVAVLETARGGILRSGLGFDACDVGVVLNVSADHLGLRGIHTVEQLAEVKAVIPATVKPGGFAVLNADQPLVLAMRERTRGAAILFSARGEAPDPVLAGHLAAGGAAVMLEEIGGREWITLREDEERTCVAAVADVPLAMRGAARFQFDNLLAAVAAAHAQGMGAEEIREGLYTFVPSGEATPGRMNVLQAKQGTVVVDYAHNGAAVRGLMEFVSRLGARRSIGVVTMPGDRRDEDLREMGRIAAVLDYVVVKEHERYRRGRPAGEVAGLITEGLEAGGLPADRREVVLAEPAAVSRALDLMQPGDVVVILADESMNVLAQVREASGNGAITDRARQ